MTKKVLACFDFDGTITFSDSLLPFILFSHGLVRTFFNMLPLVPAFVQYVLGVKGRQEVKERVLGRFFGHLHLDDVESLGREFALKKIPHLTKKDALAAVMNHKQQGHRLILISASIETYLAPWAKLHGFDDVLSSRLFVDSLGIVTGKLQGKNCREEEKVRRLQELVGPLDEYEIYAYGDSSGDKELLSIAQHPFYRNFKQ
jgi:phosphatidylglycerophosphatase C